MGMYDNLYINPKQLPISEEEKGLFEQLNLDWQTKSLNCDLTEVYITENGELKINKWQYETVPKEERPYPDDEGLKGMIGCLRRKDEHLENINYTGIVNFYTNIKKDWWEFNAKFLDGKLISIEGGKEIEA